MKSNYGRLLRDERPEPKIGSSLSWNSGNVTVSVMTRDMAGVDCDEPWIASCDTHNQMLGCPTKADAMKAARHRDWCSGCQIPKWCLA